MSYYSYLWLRDDGSPYYAGKGTKDRAYSSRGHRVRRPKDRSSILVFPQSSESEAFESEKMLIRWFGRKDLGTGCLRNMTDGGENPPKGARKGYKDSAETREKYRQANLGRVMSIESRKKVSDYQKTHDNAGRFKKGEAPIVHYPKGHVPWNKGKEFRHEKSFGIGHKAYCNHLGGYKNGEEFCIRCGKPKSLCA